MEQTEQIKIYYPLDSDGTYITSEWVEVPVGTTYEQVEQDIELLKPFVEKYTKQYPKVFQHCKREWEFAFTLCLSFFYGIEHHYLPFHTKNNNQLYIHLTKEQIDELNKDYHTIKPLTVSKLYTNTLSFVQP